jgi:hypothetical protein
MTSLAAVQRDFARAVLSGDLESFAAQLAGGPTAAARRLAIYRRAVLHNLCGALAGAYPVVRRLVGEAFFLEAAIRHAQAEPSRCGDLNRFGAGFARFLAQYPHAAALPYLPDVARLEWAWNESLAAADASGLDFAALALVSPEEQPRLRFAVHPAVRVIHSDHPVLAIWEANQAGRDGTPEASEGPDDILVHREDGRVRLARIAAPHARSCAGGSRRGRGRVAAARDARTVGAARSACGVFARRVMRAAGQRGASGFTTSSAIFHPAGSRRQRRT